MNYHTTAVDIRKAILLLAATILWLANLNAQDSKNNKTSADDENRRKFDYFFYDAVNAKAQEKYDEALDLFLYCHAIDSTNANVLMELGSFYSALDEEMAHSFFKKAVKYDPTNYYYSMMLASSAKDLGQNQEVVDIYERLVELHPEKTELQYELANAYAGNGDLKQAIDALNELEKNVGISETITLSKFHFYTLLDEKEKAFAEIKNIIEKNPDDIRFVLLMGDLYLQENETENALQYYQQAEKIDPDYPALVLAMVNYYEKTNNKEAAEQEMRKAIVSSKFDVDMKMQMLTRYIGTLQQQKQDTSGVNPLFQTLFDQHPGNSQLNYLYGNVLLIQENKAEAMKQFEIFTAENPTNPAGYEQMLRIALPDSLDRVVQITEEAIRHIPSAPQFYFYLGGAKYEQKKYLEALQVFEDALINAEMNDARIESDFYGQIGDLNYFLKEKTKAFESYDKALKLNPQNLLVLNNYSYYLSLEKKNLDRAEQMSSITVKAEPKNPTFLDTYGWILFEQGAYTTAKIYLESAVRYSEESEEPSAVLYEHLGDVLIKIGDTEKALEKWMKAQEMGSESKTLDEKIRRKEYIDAEAE